MTQCGFYRQACIAVRDAYEAGEFGRIHYSEVEYYHPGIGARSHRLSRWQAGTSWRWGFPQLIYPTHSLGYLVGVTRERIVTVSAQGQLVGDDFLCNEFIEALLEDREPAIATSPRPSP